MNNADPNAAAYLGSSVVVEFIGELVDWCNGQNWEIVKIAQQATKITLCLLVFEKTYFNIILIGFDNRLDVTRRLWSRPVRSTDKSVILATRPTRAFAL